MKNNSSITVSAPGKLLLMGDHAVVYGHPCIVTAIDKRVYTTITPLEEKQFQLESADVGVHDYIKSLNDVGRDMRKEVRFAETSVKNFYKTRPQSQGVRVEIKSDFSSKYGLGSSSAIVVAVLTALAVCFSERFTQKEMFDLAYATVREVQGAASGFDVAAAVYGGTVYFVTGGDIIEPIDSKNFSLVVGYSGIKADTTTLIQSVAQKREKESVKVNRIFEAISKLTDEVKGRMLEGDWERVGKLMDFNQEYLRDLGVSTGRLESLISAAKKSGAYGAKLSGAGGGDCMIALVSLKNHEVVNNAITEVGGEIVDIKTGAEGVRIEPSESEIKTTDDQAEQFIIVDEQDAVLGYKTRYECHHDPSLIHRTVGVLLYNSKGELLLQKRSSTKDMELGLWGISAAGHVTKGQTDDDAAHRELKEELGIDTTLTCVKKFIVRGNDETERVVVYKGFHDGPFSPNPREVERVKFHAVDAIQTMILHKEIILTVGAMATLKETGVVC